MANKTILVVDDEQDITLSIVNYLKKNLPDVNILVAFDGEKALNIIKSSNIDILITDIRMPKMDGIELLVNTKKSSPKTKAIVITAYGSDSVKSQSEKAGAIFYLEKPFELKALLKKVQSLLNEEEGFKGSVSQLDLADIIQMICLNRKSAAIEVKKDNKKGIFYIKEGEIYNCKLGDKEGEQACFEILSWDNGEFNFLPPETLSGVEKKINKNWMNLLMETYKSIDENGKNQPSPEKEKVKQKISEIVNSLYQKIDNLLSNVIINIEQKKAVLNGEITDENFSNLKVEEYSSLLQNINKTLNKCENQNFEEVIIILKDSFIIQMRISEKLVWCVKIKDISSLGMAKVIIEKTKNKLIKEIEKGLE